MPGALTWAIVLAVSPTDIPLHHHRAHCCGWTKPCGSYYDSRMCFSKNYQGTLRNRIDHSQVLEGTWHTQWPHNEVAGRENRRESGPRALLLLRWRVGCLGFQGFTIV